MPGFSTHPLSTKGRTMPIEASTSAGPSRHGPCGGGTGHKCLKYVDEMWKTAYETHSEEMDDLLMQFENSIKANSPSCSLLNEFNSLSKVLKALKAGTMANYTPKMNSLFPHYFKREQRQTESPCGSSMTKYMRIETLDNENEADGYDAEKHDVQLFFKCRKALQLTLLFNRLLGRNYRYKMKTANASLVCSNDERLTMGNIFSGPKSYFTEIFGFTKRVNSGLRVEVGELAIPNMAGIPDFVVKVIVDKHGNTAEFENCVAVCEFKKPNAGFWIPWTMMTGKTWTNEEKDAFFKLKDISSDDEMAEEMSEEWKNYNPVKWDYATKVIDPVRSNRVDVKYLPKLEPIHEEPETEADSSKQLKRGNEATLEDSKTKRRRLNTIEAQNVPGVSGGSIISVGISNRKSAASRGSVASRGTAASRRSAASRGTVASRGSIASRGTSRGTIASIGSIASKRRFTFPSSYFIRDGDDEPSEEEDLTKLLDSADFRTSFDSYHKTWSQVSKYAFLSLCSNAIIADGLTILAGSLHKGGKSKGVSNPNGSDDVWDIHFYKTHMMQTHDQNSTLDFMNYGCNRVFSDHNFRKFGKQLLLYAAQFKGRITKESQIELKRLMKEHNFSFDPSQDDDSIATKCLKESRDNLNKRERKVIAEALVDFDQNFSDLKMKAEEVDSDVFVICEWFRENVNEGIGSSEPFPGRSNSVAKVQRRGDDSGKYYVLKEYFGDQDSVARMERELEAYCRVSKLPRSQRKKHVAELISFGSLDMGDGRPTPRLFLLLEHVEEPKMRSIDGKAVYAEVTKVDELLQSVGVSHNDLDDRNFKWQSHLPGLSLKVYDFDHAKFGESPPPMERHQPLERMWPVRTRIRPGSARMAPVVVSSPLPSPRSRVHSN